MSYDLERKVISNFIHAKNFFGLDGADFGLDAGTFKEVANAGFMTINNGQASVRSVSGPSVLVGTPGVLSITFLLDGDTDSTDAKVKAQEIVDAFFEQKLDENGTYPTSSSTMIIDFGANGFVPYIASLRNEAPHVRTTVNASFLRTERKTRST